MRQIKLKSEFELKVIQDRFDENDNFNDDDDAELHRIHREELTTFIKVTRLMLS